MGHSFWDTKLFKLGHSLWDGGSIFMGNSPCSCPCLFYRFLPYPLWILLRVSARAVKMDRSPWADASDPKIIRAWTLFFEPIYIWAFLSPALKSPKKYGSTRMDHG